MAIQQSPVSCSQLQSVSHYAKQEYTIDKTATRKVGEFICLPHTTCDVSYTLNFTRFPIIHKGKAKNKDGDDDDFSLAILRHMAGRTTDVCIIES